MSEMTAMPHQSPNSLTPTPLPEGEGLNSLLPLGEGLGMRAWRFSGCIQLPDLGLWCDGHYPVAPNRKSRRRRDKLPPLFQRHIVPRDGSGIELSRAADPLFGIGHHLHPMRHPAGGTG